VRIGRFLFYQAQFTNATFSRAQVRLKSTIRSTGVKHLYFILCPSLIFVPFSVYPTRIAIQALTALKLEIDRDRRDSILKGETTGD
jgi:hypothetical protein